METVGEKFQVMELVTIYSCYLVPIAKNNNKIRIITVESAQLDNVLNCCDCDSRILVHVDSGCMARCLFSYPAVTVK